MRQTGSGEIDRSLEAIDGFSLSRA